MLVVQTLLDKIELLFPLVLLQAKAVRPLWVYNREPSPEESLFPLVLLQAKAVR